MLVVYTVNSHLADTPLLRTGAKSPTKATKKCMEITPAITELRTLHVVPNKHFYYFTLVTTDTLVTMNTLLICTCTAVQ